MVTMSLPEEEAKDVGEIGGERRRKAAASRTVHSRVGKNKEMIKEKSAKDGSRHKEADGPGGRDSMAASFKVTCKYDEPTLGGDCGDAVESCSDADKGSLEILR